MSLPPINPEPINRVTDAASESLLTGEGRRMSRWTPKWGGKFSFADIVLLAAIALVLLVIAALIIL
jgi:hypothetical protein